MVDITICVNGDCKFRETCYRFIAKPDERRQSCATFKPEDGECEHYWECKSRSLKRRLDIEQQ